MRQIQILVRKLADPRRHYSSHDDRRSAAGLAELLEKIHHEDGWDDELVATIVGAANRLLARSSLLH